jgi:rhodanese-related sulfurtransferase
VREKEEVRQGYIPRRRLHSRAGFLEMQVEEKLPDKATPIVAYCAGGTRSLLAGRI